MEIELKYLIDDEKVADEIFADDYIESIRDTKEECVDMDAIYYDTADRSLTGQEMAFRIRREGTSHVATLKWDGTSDNGMHKRQEINVPVSDEKLIEQPEITIFDQSDMSDVLAAVCGSRKLLPLIEVSFVRRVIRLDTGKSISELSVDRGEIIAGGKKSPVLELEIELFSGNEKEIVDIGNKLSEKYHLKPENKSKFERGYELLP
ncbi:CYTH domain-containing protein [Aminicella lysinilytica]|uniref:CYTH domain-containing protein n=1 Tax=Aminicella lysinilytica TaxID=433323 RepID=A0A4R6QBG8_9FIRM|nr:CYTH domain-containing protein [Aminicella lysinilytica]TDP59605.1 CYTH domain-containing protein [Aminicella lysinilytica]